MSLCCGIADGVRSEGDRGGEREGQGGEAWETPPPYCATMNVPEADKVRAPEFEMAERSDGFGADATPAERYPAGNSSAAGAIANFVNTIVGAGIVGLPFALAQVCG